MDVSLLRVNTAPFNYNSPPMSFQDYNTSSSALRKRRTIKKSINFSAMIIGESGSGRSTLINSLCGGNSIVPTSSTAGQDPFSKKLTLRHENVELEDNEGHKISLNIIDTPNFANAINCDDDFKIIVDFIRHQYDEVLLEESRVKRNPRFKDGRIHVLIYLINATGHGLSEIDVKFLQHVSGLVNVIPVIAKADSLTPAELKLNKRLILEDLNNYKIEYYKFNEYEYEEDYIDDEIIEYNKYLNSLIPFAIIGANKFQESGDEDDLLKLRVLNPAYAKPINIELPEFNDFTILKNILLITHLNEFKERTHDVIYENYRTEALSGKKFSYSNYDGNEEDGSNKDDESASYLMKEEQIKLEEERLKKFEERVHQDLINKRKELLERENELKEIEKRLLAEGLKLNEEGEVVKIDE
ncbi:septin CDC11 [Candidozyma auris]|uniref:Septin CDC11 n=2 Tax=Candidozyma auris TaxID=498019 RepID=A0A2H0ZG00_CANAR|nr:septin_CDC11 [[Candida] auris]PIS49581.1 septin CDC11 [[Candida] auris]QEO23645.1 septin_CDC11 [[Candida] auris]QRG40000.1 septin CDC11 [[Candida] auris]GBL52076.1 putative septin family protein [[Candida] auris]